MKISLLHLNRQETTCVIQVLRKGKVVWSRRLEGRILLKPIYLDIPEGRIRILASHETTLEVDQGHMA